MSVTLTLTPQEKLVVQAALSQYAERQNARVLTEQHSSSMNKAIRRIANTASALHAEISSQSARS